ncbi:Protein MIS12-like [Vitis vinifera]|uniref:Protein MIS12-like n=1 Tax=Vitis vinifera TaxID=29760 RepID=A0A438C1K6_VITVI|nr:Protein MIS12-like [Vitis vinifera]
MEGSESEAIFESLNLNPQLFINEVLNLVDDLLDGAFDFYQQEASNLLRTDGTDRSGDINKGIGYIRNMIQGVLDKRLEMWEKYCLRHCFAVPEGFLMPKAVELVGCEISGIDAIGETVHLKGGVLHWVEHLYSKRLSCLVQQTSKQSFPAVMLSITIWFERVGETDAIIMSIVWKNLHNSPHDIDEWHRVHQTGATVEHLSLLQILGDKLFMIHETYQKRSDFCCTLNWLYKLTDHVLREFEGLRDLDKEYQPPDSRWGSEHGLLSSVLWKTFLSTSHASNGKITKSETPGDSSINKDVLSGLELDAQLDSLRDKLTVVAKESAELNRELQALERQSVLSNQCTGSVNEALQLYEQNKVHDMFQEMMRTASELRTKMEKMKTKRMEGIERVKTERIYNPDRDLSMRNRDKGLFNAELEDLQEFLANIKNM